MIVKHVSVRYSIERYPIMMPKGCDMDMLDREVGGHLITNTLHPIPTTNTILRGYKCVVMIYIQAEKWPIFNTVRVVNFICIT